MAHIHIIEDKDQQAVDVLYFCSDFQHREFLSQEDNEKKYGSYQGWNGCHELEFDDNCDYCGKTIKGVMGAYPY
jgi:hypothetical protein